MSDKAPTPKMELQGEGFGVASPNEVERRARELALIDGRTDPTLEDRQRARAEFQDREVPAATTEEDAGSNRSLSRDPSDPVADRGRQTPSRSDMDEETALERLALEGVEEAQHEQMVESRNTVDEPLRSRPKRRRP